MKTFTVQIFGLLFSLANVGFSQTSFKSSYFGIRGGYQQSSTSISIAPYNLQITDVGTKNSFYGGVFYQYQFNNWLIYRAELNYQQKCLEYRDQNGGIIYQNRFHYAGLVPQIGVTPLRGLSLMIGPELNFLLKHTSAEDVTRPIELGLSGRIHYRYKWIGVELGHFKAFNEFMVLDLPEAQYRFKNRTWQAGIILVPALLK